MSKPRLLFVTDLTLWPPLSGASACAYYRLEALVRQFDVAVVRPVNGSPDQGVGPVGDSLAWDLIKPNVFENQRWEGRYYLLERALTPVAAVASALVAKIRRFESELQRRVVEFKPELVIFDPGPSIQMLTTIPGILDIPRVCIEYNVEDEWVRSTLGHGESVLRRIIVDPLIYFYARNLKGKYYDLLNHSKKCIYISGRDAEKMAPHLALTQVAVQPVLIKRPKVFKRDYTSARRIAIMGHSIMGPVATGAQWFIEEVLKREDVKALNTVLLLQPRMAKGLESVLSGVPFELLPEGPPDRIDEALLTADMLVVPLFAGSGIKFKVIFALALGMPVVATDKASEGIGIRDGVDYLHANTADEFARSVRALTDDEQLRGRIGTAARSYFESEHSIEAAAPRWIEELNSTLREVRGGSPAPAASQP
ncbi:MAG: glycosyltransferase [Verrucomicrobiales bacterium]|nr:glycosyltransferase [Verrucomicrobiales bacterium]